jgi:hypothetical protein
MVSSFMRQDYVGQCPLFDACVQYKGHMNLEAGVCFHLSLTGCRDTVSAPLATRKNRYSSFSVYTH